jgi:hypothetical protein
LLRRQNIKSAVKTQRGKKVTRQGNAKGFYQRTRAMTDARNDRPAARQWDKKIKLKLRLLAAARVKRFGGAKGTEG